MLKDKTIIKVVYKLNFHSKMNYFFPNHTAIRTDGDTSAVGAKRSKEVLYCYTRPHFIVIPSLNKVII